MKEFAIKSIVSRFIFIFAITASLSFCVPYSAWASTTWPTQEVSSVLLSFHDSYVHDGKSYSHYGVDISAPASSAVIAPLSGTISFVGSVPSTDTSEGITMRAVSLQLEDGKTMTFMPFADLRVEEGDAVIAGDTLGTLASTGDASSTKTHIHVGLKQGRTYYDPMTVLVAPTSATKNKEEHKAAETSAKTVPSEAATSSAVQTESVQETQEPSVPAKDPEPQFGTISSGVVATSEVCAEENLSANYSILSTVWSSIQSCTTAAACFVKDAAISTVTRTYMWLAPLLVLLSVLVVLCTSLLQGRLRTRVNKLSSMQNSICICITRVLKCAGYFLPWPNAFEEPGSY